MRHSGKIALVVGVIAIFLVALMLFGARLGLWTPITGFGFYRNYLNPLGGVVAALGGMALLLHWLRKEPGGMLVGGFALLVGLACLAPMNAAAVTPLQRAAPSPNITTNTTHPPAFAVLAVPRAGAQPPLEAAAPN